MTKRVTLLVDDAATVQVTGGEELSREEEAGVNSVDVNRAVKKERYEARRAQLNAVVTNLQTITNGWDAATTQQRMDALRDQVLPAVRLLAAGLRWVGDTVMEMNEDAGPQA